MHLIQQKTLVLQHVAYAYLDGVHCVFQGFLYEMHLIIIIINNNSEVLLGAIIHRPDAPLASKERKVRKLGR